jgi:hypothetical protein
MKTGVRPLADLLGECRKIIAIGLWSCWVPLEPLTREGSLSLSLSLLTSLS